MRLSRSPRPRPARDGALRALVLLAVSHGVDDLSQGVVLGLVPVFVATRHYSYAGGTAIVLAGTLMPALLEPVFGMATDRRTLPWLPEAGMAVSGLGVGLAGLAGSYPLTLAAIALSGLGVAAYHPEAGRAVRAATPSATAMGWFTFAGLSGFAVGPLALAAIDATLGPAGIPVLMGPALATAVVLVVVRRPERRRAARPEPRHEGPAPAGQEDRRGFAWLLGVVLARSVLLYGVSALAGLYLIRDLGASVALGTATTSVLFGVGALAPPVGGALADRIGRIPALEVANLIVLPLVAGLVLAPRLWVAVVFLAAVGVALNLPTGVQITLGQEYLPGHHGTAYAVAGGLAISLGGVFTPAFGALADQIGPRATVAVLGGLPLIALVLLARMAIRHRADRAAPARRGALPLPSRRA